MSTQPKPFVFVLMPFDQKFNDIYKFGIKGAADDVGAYAERVDEQIFTEGILDRVFNQISKADVIVADMTGRNPNVFYEVGYAHALGKIVLLLSQNTDDIPFDLKHRPHTVYGGQIDLLRRELVPRLQWAIAEGRKQRRPGGAERFSIRVHGMDVPAVDLSMAVDKDTLPTLEGRVTSQSFYLPVHLRNDSLEAIVGITHVYLFCAEDAILIPCDYQMATFSTMGTTILSTLSTGSTREVSTEPVPLRAFTASPIDGPDGLLKQFRLKTHFPALPPGAVEEGRIDFMFTGDHKECDAVYRISLHSSLQFYYFTFRVRIEYGPEPATEGKSRQG